MHVALGFISRNNRKLSGMLILPVFGKWRSSFATGQVQGQPGLHEIISKKQKQSQKVCFYTYCVCGSTYVDVKKTFRGSFIVWGLDIKL